MQILPVPAANQIINFFFVDCPLFLSPTQHVSGKLCLFNLEVYSKKLPYCGAFCFFLLHALLVFSALFPIGCPFPSLLTPHFLTYDPVTISSHHALLIALVAAVASFSAVCGTISVKCCPGFEEALVLS